MKKQIQPLLLAALALNTSGVIAAPTTAQPGRPLLSVSRPTQADAEYKFEMLTAPLPLPNLPAYPGRATFIRGLRYPNAKAGARVGLIYGALEEPAQIVDWYREALKNFQWKLAGETQNNKIYASQGGNVVTIEVSPSSTRSYRSELEISYTFLR